MTRFHVLLAGLGLSLPAMVLADCGGTAPPQSDCAAYSDCPPDGASGSSSGEGGSPGTDGGGEASQSDHVAPEAGDAGEGGCKAPTTLDCNGTCVDPTLPAHCGTCTACEGPDGGGQATCTNGTCGIGCDAPTSLDCSGSCVDPTLPAHCGSCSKSCPAATTGNSTAVCTLGADGGGTCSVNCTDANSQACPSGSGFACYALNDPANCNGCGNNCPGPASGNGGPACSGTPLTCGITCTQGTYHQCANDCHPNTDTPSVTADPCIINEMFGIFVSPGGTDSASCGTQLSPCKTIGQAMDLAKAASKRVYACGSAGNYTEVGGGGLVVGASRDGVSVFGGLDCTTTPSQWTYNSADRATVAPASGYALLVTGLTTGVSFTDFGFASGNATGAGASSFAVFIASSTGVTLTRCNISAGAGTQGQDQSQPAPYGTTAPPGNPGGASVSAGGTGAGGQPVTNTACATSVGGAGGSAKAGELDGQSGGPGGTNGGSSVSCNLPTPVGGGPGSPGGPGSAGAGASTWATFSAGGWTPTGGQSGGMGTVGQGGGGGGVDAALNAAGGGGGGGAGGCGGGGGPGASGGGSSVGVLAWSSTVNLASCVIVASSAGRGGNGATGQTGQPGGGGGAGNNIDDCSGGNGGNGGQGGPGGGGAGGISAGVLWSGTAPTISSGSQTPGTSGAAGQNGDGSTTAKDGAAGGVVQFQ